MNQELGQYFTLDPSSALLAQSITTKNPEKFMDLGCGDGALSSAVLSRWPNARGICLDISHQKNFELKNTYSNVDYTLVDVLGPEFERFFYENSSDIDVIVSNPPFIKRSVDNYIGDVFQSVGLHGVVDVSAPRYPAHYAFLAQSLRLVKENGEIAIILPESFVSGDKYKKARLALMSQYNVIKVLELSPGSFIRTEAKCYIIYIRKGGGTKSVYLKAANTPENYEVSVRDGVNRLDHKYYHHQKGKRLSERYSGRNYVLESLESIGFEVLRGRHTGKQAKLSGCNYCHTDIINAIKDHSFPSISFKGDRSLGTSRLSNPVTVMPGDVVISRVGSRVVGQMALVTGGEALLTDCVFRLRPTNELARAHVPSLLSHRTALYLREIAKGTCARYLTFDDIRKFEIARVI